MILKSNLKCLFRVQILMSSGAFIPLLVGELTDDEGIDVGVPIPLALIMEEDHPIVPHDNITKPQSSIKDIA